VSNSEAAQITILLIPACLAITTTVLLLSLLIAVANNLPHRDWLFAIKLSESHHWYPANNGVEWRADLMRHDFQKFFEPIRSLSTVTRLLVLSC
jgi:hypothetical protein